MMHHASAFPCLAALCLAALAPNAPTLASPNASVQDKAPTTIAVFSDKNGYGPYTNLVYVNGTLYGTTEQGSVNSKGTVISVNPLTGVLAALTSFDFESGFLPEGRLLDMDGVLYGTTNAGGMGAGEGNGTVFSVNRNTGTLKVIAFFNEAGGRSPCAGLASVNGTLYGTALGGGQYHKGTVFSVNPATGRITTLAAFHGASGEFPRGELLNVDGILYGTAGEGGDKGCGTVFSFNPATGVLTRVAEFNEKNGAEPSGGLAAVNGILYGTTTAGGTREVGTVFSFNPTTGALADVVNFNGKNGFRPNAGLVNVAGILYGTTQQGGPDYVHQPPFAGPVPFIQNGYGTVFSINPKTGGLRTVAAFDRNDGMPRTGLTVADGVLYGTTSGGFYPGGSRYGRIFALTPFAAP